MGQFPYWVSIDRALLSSSISYYIYNCRCICLQSGQLPPQSIAESLISPGIIANSWFSRGICENEWFIQSCFFWKLFGTFRSSTVAVLDLGGWFEISTDWASSFILCFWRQMRASMGQMIHTSVQSLNNIDQHLNRRHMIFALLRHSMHSLPCCLGLQNSWGAEMWRGDIKRTENRQR